MISLQSHKSCRLHTNLKILKVMFLMMTKLKFLEVDTIQFQENFSELNIVLR